MTRPELRAAGAVDRAMRMVVGLLLAFGPAGGAAAQLGPAPEVDPCGPEATRVARFAARTHGWDTARPTVTPRGTLGGGVVWHAYDSPACCGGRRCGGASERDDALVGAVGRRLFALTAQAPELQAPGTRGNRLARAWSPPAWARFIVAARAAPETPGEAIGIAWLVYASVHPAQGLIVDLESPDLIVMEGQRGELEDAALAAAVEVRSDARLRGDGFAVVLWTSRHVWFPELRIRPMGATSGERLRRAMARVDRRGVVTFVADVEF